MPKHYLHYWNVGAERFTSYEEEAASNFGGLEFPDSPMMRAYPGGYKLWRLRAWYDAPDWVKQERERRVRHS